MKKLMIALALVCAAVVSQAASIDWECTKQSFVGYGKASTDKDRYSGIYSYLFAFADTSAATACYTALTSGDLTFAEAISTYSVGSAQGNTSTSSKSAGAISTKVTHDNLVADADSGTSYRLAMFVIGDDSHFLLSSDVSGTAYLSEADKGVAAKFSSGQFSTTADTRGGWTAVASTTPEPTSAMLLLLGFAGLALRRRRA